MVTLNGFTYIKPLLSYTKEVYILIRNMCSLFEDESNASDDYLEINLSSCHTTFKERK